VPESDGGSRLEAAAGEAAAQPAPTPTDEKPTIRVGGFLKQDGKLLMVEQGRRDERYWLLPGGGVRFGETLAQALVREIQEELALRVAVGRLLAIVESISPEPDYPKHVVHLIFEVSAAPEAESAPQEATVFSARYFSEHELDVVDVRPPVSEFLAACLRELPSSPQYLGRRW
jgi:8-oxo-dGTP diphosphatase